MVIGILTLLMSVLLPSLGAARQMAEAALCSANLRGLYNAGTIYAAQSRGWMAPTVDTYYYPSASTANNDPRYSQPVPSIYEMFGSPYDSPIDYLTALDAYAAMHIVPITQDFTQRRYNGAYAEQYVTEVEIAVCPRARASWNVLDSVYVDSTFRFMGDANTPLGFGRLRASYFWSSLMTSCGWETAANRFNKAYRDNANGPFKTEEISDSSTTIWCGDGQAMTDTGNYAFGFGPSDVTRGRAMGVDVTFRRDFNYCDVGKPQPLFGTISTIAEQGSWWTVSRSDWDYYHYMPCAVHWDGHVATYSDPPANDQGALHKHLTRDGTGVYVPDSIGG